VLVIIAMVTDFDCWKQSGETVNAEMVVQNMQQNVSKAQTILEDFVPRIRNLSQYSCSFALKNAIISKEGYISKDTLAKLEPIVKKDLTV
jgi:5'-methylthioadenosine phosphorylase